MKTAIYKNGIYYFKHPILFFVKCDQHFFNAFFARKLYKKCKCSFCQKEFHHFLMHGYFSKLSEKHNVTLGPRLSDCPFCRSVDKYRWLWYVLEDNIKIVQQNKGKILHFAPEKPIVERISSLISKENYITGDLVEGRAKYVVDMTDIQFDDNEFDLVIACNVLEHIPNESKAINELKRVLKPDGTIILMIPVCYDINETLEDPSICAPEDRLKLYGQEDHVRLYGNDYVARFKKYDLIVDNLKVEKYFNEKKQKQYGLTKVSPILICKLN